MENVPQFKKTEALTEAEKVIYNRLVVPYEEKRLQLEDFKNLKGFDSEIIERQIIQIEDFVSSRKDIPSKISEVLEVLMAELIEKADWLDGAYTIQTTKFDDFINSTDFVLEWEDDPPLRLAVDITSSSTDNPQKQEKLRSKLEKTEKRLIDGKGTHIIYFESQVERDKDGNSVKRKLFNIPKVVLSMDRYNLEKLSRLFVPVLEKKEGAWDILGSLGRVNL